LTVTCAATFEDLGGTDTTELSFDKLGDKFRIMNSKLKFNFG